MAWVGAAVFAAYALVLVAVLGRAYRRADLDRFGPANRITLVRAGLVGVVAALVATDGPVTVLVPVATVAVVLDGVDGAVARRTGSVTGFGARFDMEVDAVLLALLSLAVAHVVGPWVVLIGAARYLWILAYHPWPWLGSPLPVRYWRKAVAVVQAVVLLLALTGWLPRPLTIALVAVALAALVWSFATSAWWLARRRAGSAEVSDSQAAEPGRGRRTPGVATPR